MIRTDAGAHMRKMCIFEEIFQSFGLPADHWTYRPSLMCEADRHIIEPTEIDRLLLKALYDPRLKAGMSEEEAMPIAAEILRELWPD